MKSLERSFWWEDKEHRDQNNQRQKRRTKNEMRGKTEGTEGASDTINTYCSAALRTDRVTGRRAERNLEPIQRQYPNNDLKNDPKNDPRNESRNKSKMKRTNGRTVTTSGFSCRMVLSIRRAPLGVSLVLGVVVVLVASSSTPCRPSVASVLLLLLLFLFLLLPLLLMLLLLLMVAVM